MIDHIGMSVRDIARASEFYRKALAPLGIGVVMEVSAEDTGHGAAIGFGARLGSRSSGSARVRLGNQHIHVAFAAASRETVDAFYAPQSPPAARTMALRACARDTTRIITPPSCSTPTATISRPFVTALLALKQRRGSALAQRGQFGSEKVQVGTPASRFAACFSGSFSFCQA